MVSDRPGAAVCVVAPHVPPAAPRQQSGWSDWPVPGLPDAGMLLAAPVVMQRCSAPAAVELRRKLKEFKLV